MQTISDLPAHVFDQIVGRKNTSYAVIRLWLCGDKKLQRKLSVGLTYLDLKSHCYGDFLFPRMVFELKSLRHLSIESHSSLVPEHSLHEWPVILRSLPNTLETLAICARKECIWNRDEERGLVVTTYPRGDSAAVDLATLFPRLHTLRLRHKSRDFAATDWFPALPSSLTLLEASVTLDYTGDNTNHLSRLPPGLLKLTGRLRWNLNVCEDGETFGVTYPFSEAAIDAFRRDCANAPPGLQSLNGCEVYYGTNQYNALRPDLQECWLPKSLLSVVWKNRNWTPAVARTMPPNLTSLDLSPIGMDAYIDSPTNWVADLPRKLTSLDVRTSQTIDFASYGRFLPPGLTVLVLGTQYELSFGVFGVFGDWNSVTGAGYWPSTLTTLRLCEFDIEPHQVVAFPQHLTMLQIRVASPHQSAEFDAKPTLRMNLLPSSLTRLILSWKSSVRLELSFSVMRPRSVELLYLEGPFASFDSSSLYRFPDSVTDLRLENVELRMDDKTDRAMLPNLYQLEVSCLDWKILEFLPRGVQSLLIDRLIGASEDSYPADGQILKHLPTSLKQLTILGAPLVEREDFAFPPQRLDHLASLTDLHLLCDFSTSADILRMLPTSIKRLRLNIATLTNDDLPYLLPHLEVCNILHTTPELVRWMTLASLASCKRLSGELADIAEERVQHAAAHQ